MRPNKFEPEEVIVAIRDVFREHGFDGASLSLLAEATGLQRASLYHRFPDGKDGMAVAAIDSVTTFLEHEVFEILEADGEWRDRLQSMCRTLDAYYDGGRTLCLLTAFSIGAVPEPVRRKARRVVRRWREQLAALAIDAGRPIADAKVIAEQILVEIQGGLVVAALMIDVSPFQNALARLPDLISLAPESVLKD